MQKQKKNARFFEHLRNAEKEIVSVRDKYRLMIEIAEKQAYSEKRLPLSEYARLAKYGCPNYYEINMDEDMSDNMLCDCPHLTCGECWYNYMRFISELSQN